MTRVKMGRGANKRKQERAGNIVGGKISLGEATLRNSCICDLRIYRVMREREREESEKADVT